MRINGKPSGSGFSTLISTCIRIYRWNNIPRLIAFSTWMKFPSLAAIFSALTLVINSRGSPCIFTQNTDIFVSTSRRLKPGGYLQMTIGNPLMFHGHWSKTLCFSCSFEKVNENMLTSKSSMLSVVEKLHADLMVA